MTFNALAPGLFRSRMTAFAPTSEEAAAHTNRAIPIGRIGVPEDLGGALLFLCGRAGAYVTGAILPLDGGLSCRVNDDMWFEGSV